MTDTTPKTEKEKVADETAVSVEEKSQDTQGPTVLLVEDDPLLTKMYNTKLASDGMNVLVAQNGQEGFEVASKENIDLIVLDMMMPQLSGIGFLEKLRATEKGKTTPVLVLTNLTDKEEQEKAMKLGVKEYVTKASLTPGELVTKIKTHLG